MKKHVNRLKVLHGLQEVGTLAITDRGQILFEYAPQWLSAGFDLAPKSLAFNGVPQGARDPLFNRLHGVFNDSLPDGWRLLLMDRIFNNRLGWSRHQITPLDRLAYIGQRAMGATEEWLDFCRNDCAVPHPAIVLNRIADAMSCTLDQAYTDDRIPQALLSKMSEVWQKGLACVRNINTRNLL